MKYICFQGEFYREDKPFMGLNRAFKYADGCFESMRSFGDRIPLLDWHFDRLRASLDQLQIDTEKDFFLELRSALLDTIFKNELEEGARLRLTVFRKGGGKYLPMENYAAYLVEAEEAEPKFQLNTKGLNIELAKNTIIYPTPYSSLKLIGSPFYIHAAKEKESLKVDEIILCNNQGHLVEASASNLFMVKGKEVYTTPLSSGALNGVMRAYLKGLIDKLGYQLIEKDLIPEDLLNVEEIFFSNAVSGIKWVASFRRKRYFKNLSHLLVEKLNQDLL